MDLFSDLSSHLRSYLASKGMAHDPNADVRDLLDLALNHEMKNVRPTPRQVFTSPEFQHKCLALDPGKQQALAEIIGKFQHGDDISGHLSKRSARPEETDALLAAWDIFHLHISSHMTNTADKFFARTRLVLFAHISDSATYLFHRHLSTWPRIPGDLDAPTDARHCGPLVASAS